MYIVESLPHNVVLSAVETVLSNLFKVPKLEGKTPLYRIFRIVRQLFDVIP